MDPHYPVRCWLAFLVLGLSGAGGQTPEIPKGRVLPTVACSADQSQTYALYIPSSFNPEKTYPILLCFDPGARGRAPVERFQAAAETFGWLVAGSNNSRNGPWEANAKAINAMYGDLSRHLPLDRKRIYVAGLSGGARVACQIALGGLAQGVIACSAAFPGSEVPAKLPFAFFGTAGVTDFNYRELRRVDRELADRKAVHRVVIFDGGHEWLPPELARAALAWLELHAMRAGTRPKDDAWIASEFEARRGAVPAAPALDQLRALKSLVADFKGLADTAEFESRAKTLAAARDVRDAEKRERARERAEDSLTENLLSAIVEGFDGTVRRTVADLKAKTDPADRVMATRVLQGAASSAGEMAREALRQRDFAAAAPLLEMSLLLRPGRAQTYFELARARAELGDRARMLAALREAVQQGFKDAARVKNETAFNRYRALPEFEAVVAGMK